MGIHVFRQLKNESLPGGVELFELGTAGIGLLDYFQAGEKVIIVDAVKGFGKPGEIFKVDILNGSLPPFKTRSISAHDIGISEVVEIAKRLYPGKLPGEMTLIGVEVGVMDKYDTTLTPPVQNAVFKVKELILKELNVDVPCLNGGK